MHTFFSTAGLAQRAARRPWRVLGMWLVLLVFAVVMQGGLADALSSEQAFTNNPDSAQGLELIEERLGGPEALTETVIVQSDEFTVDDPEFKTMTEQTTANLRELGAVVQSATNYYEASAGDAAAAQALVSEDRHTALIAVTLAGTYDDIKQHGTDYLETIRAQNANGFEVLTVGDLSANEIYGEIAEEDLASAEMFGLPVALIILVVVFGALVAAGVPLILALVSIMVAIGLTAMVGQVFPLSDIVVNMITMIGLAVGIDYALFVVERYREERRRGVAKHDAITIAGGTASKAVLFSGLTVVIALLGMFILPISVFRSIGAGAIMVVLVAVFATTTLTPALLSLLGDKIDWPRRRTYPPTPVAARAVESYKEAYQGFWGRITRIVMSYPVISVVLAVGLLVTAALPYIDLKTGQAGIETLPESEVKTAYMILDEKFNAGILAPVEIVIDGDATNPQIQSGVQNLTAALGQDPQFGLAEVQTSEADDLTVVSVPSVLDSGSPAAEAMIEQLRDVQIPAAFGDAPAEIYVTGAAAFNHDFNSLLDEYMPIVFAFVLSLSFILLMLAFRSIIVPIKAILMNLLSVGAAYGVLTLVFQKGIGNELFGFQQTSTITAWIPIFLFSILFGLSMDYHVFLLSRIREHFDQTHDNRESVAVGLHSTAKIITGAALIMVAVFSAFAAGQLVEMQQMGFGLAVAVLIDATIVRSVLVPASMALLGNINWYLPRWLHWLPDLRVEGAPAHPSPASVPVEALDGLGTSAATGD